MTLTRLSATRQPAEWQKRVRARHVAQHGFTYLGILIAVAIIGATLASAGVIWHTAKQRERERQLLFVGDQIRSAIGHYYSAGAGAARQYPARLEDLLRDPRQPGVVRYLRKLYIDPITGTTDWGLIRDPNSRVMGVFSVSEEKPIKQANFSVVDRQFEGMEKYSDWKFVYVPAPSRRGPTPKPATQPAPGTLPPVPKS
jgi:type II secretory pathway pseudopilin PulG